MAMELRQSLKMTQALVMTPQLQQAIKLLQLSRTDLIEHIQQEIEQNPLLEEPEEGAEDGARAPGEASLLAANEEVSQEAPSPESTLEVTPEQGPSEIDWEAYLNSYQLSDASTQRRGGEGDEFRSFESSLVKRHDLLDHLNQQLAGAGMNDAEERISRLILGNLDDTGLLKLADTEGDPLIALASEADVSLGLAQNCLQRIQRLDPLGCGARDVQECLLVQLREHRGPTARLLATMIKKHLKTLEQKNLSAIARDLGVPLDEVVAAMKLLAQLNPKPARNFSDEDTHFITPDVYVYKVGGEYSIVLNEDGVSKLRISEGYRQALKGGQLVPGRTKEFVQEKYRSAVWLIRSIQQRQRTIYKVTESIVRLQRDFLDRGIDYLKPLILRDVAMDIGMHESTVSRVTSNKYVHTPQGTFELKYFFNSSISRTSGADIASEAVKNHLLVLVGAENPTKPRSDQELVELLRRQGIDIARRTVAKYREVLGVLPSSKRRKFF